MAAPRFRYLPLSQRLGVTFADPVYWRLHLQGAACFSHFIKALGILFKDGQVLYLEGTTLHPKVSEYLAARPAPAGPKVALGSAWPVPKVHRMPITVENLEGLFALAQRYTVTALCDRLHVLDQGRVVLDGHDILDQTCKLSGEVLEATLRKFCRKLNVDYERVEETPMEEL